MREGTRANTTVAGILPDGGPATFVVAAHELKSPLSLIRQLSLALESGDISHDELSRSAQQITLTSERALRLTSDLTRESRRDEVLFDLEPLNPVSLCEEVAHELTPLFKAHGKDIIVRKRTQAPLVVANRDLLRRILLNFGDNALHYTAIEQPIEFQARTTGDIVRVGVRDYGPAVPVDAWRSLQQRLSNQSTQPLGARPHSSGLGLYIARQFAQIMNGDIGAIRHRDGATFYVDMMASRQLSLLG